MDLVRVPVVLNRPPAGPTRHPVPPSRRVRHGVEVRDRLKDRRDHPVGYRRPPHEIPVHLVTGCRSAAAVVVVVSVDRHLVLSSHHHQPVSCAIQPDRQDQAMDPTTGDRWPFVFAIYRCDRQTRA